MCPLFSLLISNNKVKKKISQKVIQNIMDGKCPDKWTCIYIFRIIFYRLYGNVLKYISKRFIYAY